MDLQRRKIILVQEVLRLQNEEIISRPENLLKTKKSELFGKKLTPMSIDQFNHEIDQAMTDSENERITSAVDLRGKVKKMGLTVYRTQFAEDKPEDIFLYIY